MRRAAILSSLYDILGLAATASEDKIKSAFRKAALQHHPDRNDSPEATARFRVIYNAYSVLADPVKRRDYDAYLRSSTVFSRESGYSARPAQGADRHRITGSRDTLAAVLNHLNYILWEIEDFLRTRPDWKRDLDGFSLQGHILKILYFIDRWVLSTAGFPDYFFEVRNMNSPAKPDVPFSNSGAGHRPFVSINDYFYNIRVRTDKLLNRTRLVDLLELVPGTGIRIIDCLFEAHNLCIHTLGYVKSALAGEIDTIPPFRHTDPCFDG